jgi:large conductance mechanosensitive channel
VIQEFRDFIDKGGVFEAAVGLVMALAFVPVVDSIVEYLLMPIVAAIFGQPDFTSLSIDIGDAEIGYGFILTAIVSFLSIAFVLFLLVKAYNRATRKQEEEAGPSDNDLLVEIRDALVSRG